MLPVWRLNPMEDKDIKNIEENVEEEIKEEQPLEEQPKVEEEKPVEDKPYQVIIEDERKALYKSYSNSRMVSNILMFVMVGGIVGVMFLVMQNQAYLKYIGFGLAGALVVGMLVYFFATRNKFPNKTKAYIAKISGLLNERQFANQEYSEIKSDPEEKMPLTDVISDGIYAEANGINSRNVVRGVFREHHFLYAEIALLRPSSRKQQVPPLFVGKYVSIPNSLEFDGRIVLVYKNPKQPLDLPNAVSDLLTLEEKEDFVVYGPEGVDYKKTIGTETLSALNRIKVEGNLLNLNVVFWKGHSAIYLSYDDTVMSVPFDKPFDYNSHEKSFSDLYTCLSAVVGK